MDAFISWFVTAHWEIRSHALKAPWLNQNALCILNASISHLNYPISQNYTIYSDNHLCGRIKQQPLHTDTHAKLVFRSIPMMICFYHINMTPLRRFPSIWSFHCIIQITDFTNFIRSMVPISGSGLYQSLATSLTSYHLADTFFLQVFCHKYPSSSLEQI